MKYRAHAISLVPENQDAEQKALSHLYIITLFVNSIMKYRSHAISLSSGESGCRTESIITFVHYHII
jgi:hypothetical protein